MLSSDASSSCINGSLANNINTETISEIQKELDPNDIISMVFLLYDSPDTALERLVLLEQICKNGEKRNLDLLHDWAIYSQSQSTWKLKFLEALVVCQLFRVIRKLGIEVHNVKQNFMYDGFICPMKKELYTLCENITSNELHLLKKTLLSFGIDAREYESFELVLLSMMSTGSITIPQNSKNTTQPYSIGKLIEVLNMYPKFELICSNLKNIENRINSKIEKRDTSTPYKSGLNLIAHKSEDKVYAESFEDAFKLLKSCKIDDDFDSLQSDAKRSYQNAYVIKKLDSVGLCYIINQEKFYPSKQSKLEGTELLDDRLGSTKDKITLEKSFSALKYEVITDDNLNRNDMIENIKNIIKTKVREYHSIFVLVIMSHGIRDYIYAADCVKVKVDYIQSLLFAEDANRLKDMPKIMIMQVCRVKDEISPSELVADSPLKKHFIKRSDFYTYWATAPEFKAYRCPKRGSIFIQAFCKVLNTYGKCLDFIDICLKVNNIVKELCTNLEINQLPEITCTIDKKIFLQQPSA